MARPVANVDITVDTWETLVQRENTLLDALSNEIITANSTFANTGAPGAQRNAQLFGAFVANTFVVATALRGGSNTSVSSNLNITSNVLFTGASINVSSNTTITGTVNTTANVTASGTRLNVFGTLANITSNVAVTANSFVLNSNSTVTAFTYTANSTATTVGIGGTTLTVTPNTTFNSSQITSTANVLVTSANQIFRSNTSVTAFSITGNTTATALVLGGTTLSITSNTTISGTNHAIAGNVAFDTNTLYVDSVNNRVGIGNTTPGETLTVGGTGRFTGNVAIVGVASLSSNLNVTGLSTVQRVIATGNATFQNVVTIQGNTSVAGELSTGNTVTIKNELVIDVSANTNVGSNAAPRMIYSFPKATYRSGKLTVQASNSGNNQIAEMVIAHDNTTAFMTVYGVVAAPQGVGTDAPLGTFTAAINNANVEIFVQQTISNSAVTVIANLIK